MSQKELNPAAIATLPIAVVLTLSALLPYFQAGDSFSGYSFSLSGWSFFSTVDLLMLLSIPLAALLLTATLVPQLRDGRVRATLGGTGGGRSPDLPLTVVPAAALALLAALIFFLVVLRILFPPEGLSPGAGLFLGALLAAGLAGSAGAAIVVEIAPPRSASAFTPTSPGPDPPPTPKTQPQPGPVPPAPGTLPPPLRREPPPPASGTRRG